jgi:Rab GDP dissociation inhibitor
MSCISTDSLQDIYIACVSSAHNVCPKGYYIAIVSTIAESSANHHLELQPGLERLGKIEEQFMVGLGRDTSS